jgi:hypothetical protein
VAACPTAPKRKNPYSTRLNAMKITPDQPETTDEEADSENEEALRK